LDNQDYAENQKLSTLSEAKESTSETQLQIEQITSDLDEIEAYLQRDNTKTVEENAAAGAGIEGVMTPILERREDKERHEGLCISINPELKSGREIMSYEQEMRHKSACKELPCDVSNNKKKVNEQANKEQSIEERIQN
jgi:hypothetical protein